MTKTIEYTVRFNTNPANVYDALMDSEKHTAFCGAPATIENKEGGSFSCYGGALQGTTTKLEENKKIVQQWRAGDWEEGVYSELTYELEQKGDQTELNFVQTGVPDKSYNSINEGWENMYWAKMKTYFEK